MSKDNYMYNSSIKKTEQLGMPVGTASNRLRKELIFHLIKRLGENYCFQCNTEIEKVEDLSIEHKTPYLDSENPVKLFFDIDNIAFSHLSCNCAAARVTRKMTHPSSSAYKSGCRCAECTEANTVMVYKYRNKRKI